MKTAKTLAALGGVLVASIAAMAQSFSGNYEIVNAGSGMVLEVLAWSTTNGAYVDQWIGNSGANQVWTLSGVGTGAWQIINENSGLALEVAGQSTANGASVDQWAWNGGSNQKWSISSLGNGNYKIVNQNSGLVLEVSGQSTADDAAIDQSAWWGGASQQWLILPVGASGGTVSAPSGGSGAAAATFRGFNWADPGDNFIDGPLLLSGMSATNNYVEAQAVAATVLGAFSSVGANAVRMPINPQTVIGSWWTNYKGAIDEATGMGMKVILGVWTGSSDKNGMVNDLTTFWPMWDKVVTNYNGNGNVYFEILNEPFGYGASDWLNVVSNWLQRYPTVARGRVFVGGTGSCQNVPAVASSSVTSGCLYSVHDYGFWNTNDISDPSWYSSLSNEVGSYTGSTVLTEFGAPMTAGWDYAGGDQNNYGIASVIGFCDYCRDSQIGSIYWPGLRDGDSYSMFTRNAATTALSLNSPGGIDLVKYSWSGFKGAGTYQIVNGNSGLALEPSGGATNNGSSVAQWLWGGGAHQQWTLSYVGNGYSKIINQNSGLALEVSGESTVNGAAVDQRAWNGGASQQWAVSNLANGFYEIINGNSGLALEVNGWAVTNGGEVDQWSYDGGANQEWTFGPAASPPVTFSITPIAGGQFKLQWPQGTLLEATNLLGPWTTNAAASPAIVTPAEQQMYYRQTAR